MCAFARQVPSESHATGSGPLLCWTPHTNHFRRAYVWSGASFGSIPKVDKATSALYGAGPGRYVLHANTSERSWTWAMGSIKSRAGNIVFGDTLARCRTGPKQAARSLCMRCPMKWWRDKGTMSKWIRACKRRRVSSVTRPLQHWLYFAKTAQPSRSSTCALASSNRNGIAVEISRFRPWAWRLYFAHKNITLKWTTANLNIAFAVVYCCSRVR